MGITSVLNAIGLTVADRSAKVAAMPRLSREESFERTLQGIIDRAAAEIAQAVRQNIADEVTRMVGGASLRRGTAGRVARVGRKRAPILCPVPNCGKPGGGPKWGWFCADHKNLPKSEKDEIRAKNRPRGGVSAMSRSRKKK